MYAVTVDFVVEPSRWNDFLPLILENSRASREREPGCRQFDVCFDEARTAALFLYELYDDRAALDAHLAAPHFLAFAAATQDMITDRAISTRQRIDP